MVRSRQADDSTREVASMPAGGCGWETMPGWAAPCAAMTAAEDDEAAAAEARARYRAGPMVSIEPDRWVCPVLLPGERVVATRAGLRIDQVPADACTIPSVTGRLYVTSSRIVHISDAEPVSFDLDAIEDAGVGGGELLLTLRGGRSAVLHTDRPRLLRVEIAAARAAARREATGRSDRPLRVRPSDQDRSR